MDTLDLRLDAVEVLYDSFNLWKLRIDTLEEETKGKVRDSLITDYKAFSYTIIWG